MSPRPLHREPLVVALVLLNLGLGGLLLRKEFSPPRASPPEGHPGVSVPGMTPGAQGLPPGHPDITGGAQGSAPMGGMGGPGVSEMSSELAAVAAAAKGEAPASDFAISGTVTLSGKLKSPWPAGAPVFVIARDPKGGPPFAARRYDGVMAPFKYALGPGDVMFAGAAAPTRLVVTVRVDQDGDALTRQPGDLEGGPSAAIGPRGSADVTVDRPAAPAPGPAR